MKKRIIILLLSIFAALPAWAQNRPTDWYWQVTDSNPAINVWQSSSGTYVSNTIAAFNTWLVGLSTALNNANLVSIVSGAVTNGGLCRLTVASSLGWSTNQTKTVTGIGGATGCNGAFAITVISATIVDLQASTFGGAYTSGGVIGSGEIVATDAARAAIINIGNASLDSIGLFSGRSTISGLTTTLTALGGPIPLPR